MSPEDIPPQAAAAPAEEAAPDLSPAGFWIRLGAFVIDSFFLSAVNFVILFASGIRVGVISRFAFVLISVAYYGLTLGAWGQSFGKMLAGIMVVRDADGGPLGFPRAFGRALACWVSGFVLGVGYLIAAFTPRKRSLHDYIAGTRVIYPQPVGALRKGLVIGVGVAVVALMLTVIFGIVMFFGGFRGGGRAQGLLQQSREGVTKGGLGSLRAALSIYYGDAEGAYPQDPKQLLAPLKPGGLVYLAAIPSIEIKDHPNSSDIVFYGGEVCLPGKGNSSSVIDPTKLRDTGKWGYVADKNSPCWGSIFVDCTHQDSRGVAWHSY